MQLAPPQSADAPLIAMPGLAYPMLQRATPPGSAEDPLGGTETDPSTTAMLSRLRGTGRALPSEVAAPMGGLLGADLSKVRVHHDQESDRLSRSLQAKAFTHGNDVYFTSGSYSPSTRSGQHLLAHELAHVVQSDTAAPTSAARSSVLVGLAHDPAEAAADAMADRVMRELPSAGPKAIPAPLRRSTGRNGKIVRRSPESAALLTELAEPKVFEGPTVDVQKEIIRKLEARIEPQSPLDESILVLGGIELNAVPATPEGEPAMVDEAVLTDMQDHSLNPRQGPPIPTAFQLVMEAGAERDVVINTLHTMIAARQIEYLRKSGFIGAEWKVLVEVHYYRRRDKQANQFHKDTLGQTLFVNLNYATDSDVVGPEYIRNPSPVAEHDERTARYLPQEFRDDLQQTRGELGDPDLIKAPTIPANGVVAFVDEAIHHMTPKPGHRDLSGGALDFFLGKKYGRDLVDRIKAAYGTYSASRYPSFMYPFASYLTGIPDAQHDADKWLALMQMCSRTIERFGRPQFLAAGMSKDEIDELMAEQGGGGYKDVSIPKVSGPRRPVQPGERPPLERQMSQKALAGQLPPPLVGDRKFFRTWVRAVRRDGPSQPID